MANEEKRPLKVFLCHASGDKPPVRDLYKRLTAEGVDAWLDQEKLLPGQDWRLEIPRAVHEADVVVVCLSSKSITKEGYVQKEIKFALDIAEEKPEGTIFLIPARLEDCIVPERLSRWHWVDLYEENGFMKLLRSLKLRANVVGAIVAPVSYEDSDKELERRLSQLYTEGLAAYYTEDWDKACHRFQTILSERPSHKNAAEKLAEAECQRQLAKLYVQATEAYQSENWQVAISALEALSRTSIDYKDAGLLLKNARKQKRLQELYEEARTLHAAQKWEAVVKVFEQISMIEPNYPDADGLLASAHGEVVELKRISDLNDLYSNAVGEMDAGNWYEARRLLESVHKSQTGFLETEKLLRKVENEISKEEEKRKQNDQINTLYEQAHGLLRSKKWRNVLDKLEEIRKLDEHFPDADGIVEKVQKELEREEQETDRQNKLAAMYAEAVRLMKEERYQEALDKWQEVKTVDSKYPDHQWVQRTARRKLKETEKPLQSKPRFVMSRSLWIWIGGFVVVAVVITGFALSGQNGQNPLPTLTSAPTKNVIVNPPATNVPHKTSTPRPATPVPTTSGYSDPTMYDDFDNILYENGYNKTQWGYWTSSGGPAPLAQKNGELFVTMGVNKEMDINLTKYQRAMLSKPTFMEARVLLESNTNRSNLTFGIEAYNKDKDKYDGYSWCSIANNPNTGKQDLNCGNAYFGRYQEASLNISGIEPMWHLIRIEIDPVKMQTVFIVDGNYVEPYTLPQAEILKSDVWRFGPGMYRESVKDPSPIARIDYVRMGAIEDDPNILLYEDFDKPAFDGSYDKNTWETCRGSDPNGKVIQNNGVLSIARPGAASEWSITNVCAQKLENIKLSGKISFEADLMFPNLPIGQVRLGIVNNIGGAGCIHHYFYNINDYITILHCDYHSSTKDWVSKVKDVKPGTWHSARIELDTSTGKLVYYLDGQQYDTYDTGSELSQTGYWFVLTVMAESPNDVDSYIDNVRIRRIEN